MSLLRRHGEPILEPDPDGPAWQRGSTFNPTVLRLGEDEWRMLFRATSTTEFGVAGAYASHIGVADSTDGVRWTVRPSPLLSPTLPEEDGLGCEDPRATVVNGEVRVCYTGAELRPGWRRPKVRVLHATVRDDFTSVDKHGVLLATGSPDVFRVKAAAWFPDGSGLVFTFASESPYGTIMLADGGAGPDGIARMFVNDRDRHVLLAPAGPVERGPEVGAVPIRFGDAYVMIYCPANPGPARRWCVGALLLDASTRRVVGVIDDLLVPQTTAEREGVVADVAFPSGAVHIPERDEIRVYYGGGDRASFLAYGRMSELVEALRAAPPTDGGWPY
jgi:predicted GH43/DUF377 family glycosyl hydrolase